jgi:hypothetical protein
MFNRSANVQTKLTFTKIFSAAALLCAAAAAQADITVYTSQADFLAAVSATGVDTFDDLTVDPYGDTLNRTAGTYSYDAYSVGGLWGAGGAGDHWLSTNSAFDPIRFSNFSGGVTAFGGNFFGSDITGQYALGNVQLTAADGSVLSYDLNGATTTSFLGFVSSTPLSSVTLNTDGAPGIWPTANNVVLAVPEPSTYAMLLAGLGFVGLMSRRRRG